MSFTSGYPAVVIEKHVRSRADAGGVADEKRLASLGERTRLIPWPDFPHRLAQGEREGVFISFETIASAPGHDRIRIAAHRSSRLSERMVAVAGNFAFVSLAIYPGKAIVGTTVTMRLPIA